MSTQTGHLEGPDWFTYDVPSQYWSGGSYYYTTNRNTLNLSLDGNYFAEGVLGGDHEIRFGVDYYTADTTSQTYYPNHRTLYVYDRNNIDSYKEIWWINDHIFDVGFKRLSFYLADTVTFGKLTANVGLRYDKEQGKVNPHNVPGVYWTEPGSSADGMPMFPTIFPEIENPGYKVPVNWDLFSPRVSLTYDINGNGKNVAKFSAGRYMAQGGNTLANLYFPYRYARQEWYDSNMDNTPQFNELGGLLDWYPFFPYFTICPEDGCPNIMFDPDYRTPYLCEFLVGFEKAISDDFSFGVTFMRKKTHNQAMDVDQWGYKTHVSKGLMWDGKPETKDNWQDIGTTQVGGTQVPTYQQVEHPFGAYYYNYDKGHNRYWSLQFLLTKKLSNKWMANLSFTWQDWKRFREEDEIVDMNNYDFFNEGVVAPVVVDAQASDIWMNSRWMVKFTGMYQLPWGLNLTGFFQAREGYPQPLRRTVYLNQGPVPLYRAGYKAGDERLPTFWMLNLGLEKTLKVTDTVTATLVIDWYNATNNQIELKHDLNIGAEDPGEPEPIMWTNAGLFQFGVRVNF